MQVLADIEVGADNDHEDGAQLKEDESVDDDDSDAGELPWNSATRPFLLITFVSDHLALYTYY